MPYQRALAHRLGFEPGSPDYETTALPTELSRLLSFKTLIKKTWVKWKSASLYPLQIRVSKKKKKKKKKRNFLLECMDYYLVVCFASPPPPLPGQGPCLPLTILLFLFIEMLIFALNYCLYYWHYDFDFMLSFIKKIFGIIIHVWFLINALDFKIDV